MVHTVEISEIENIWAEENEKFEFIGKFKRGVHISFKGEDQFTRWTNIEQDSFLKSLKIEGKLKKILFSDKITIEVL